MDYREQIEYFRYMSNHSPNIEAAAYATAAQSITVLLDRAGKAESKLEKAEKEKAAAVSLLEYFMSLTTEGCKFCAHYEEVQRGSYVESACDIEREDDDDEEFKCTPKWRGVKEE